MEINVLWIILLLVLILVLSQVRHVLNEHRRVLSYGGLELSWRGLSEAELRKLRRGLHNQGGRLSMRWGYLFLQLKDNAHDVLHGSPSPELISEVKSLLEKIEGHENVPLEFAKEKITRNRVLPATCKRFETMTKAARSAHRLKIPLDLADRLEAWILDAEAFRDSVAPFNLPPDPNFERVLVE